MKLAAVFARRPSLPIINSSNLRVALLDTSRRFEDSRYFPAEQWGALETFAPNILAGSSTQLQRLLDRMSLQTVNVGSVDHSVFVLTQMGDAPLSDRFRDRLWTQFHVPVYEIYVDEQAQLLAFECEAHEGWHVEEGLRFATASAELLLHRNGRMVRTGLKWVTAEVPCACGREGTRLMPPSSLEAADPAFAFSR